LFDLLPLTRKHYYHPQMKGSWSVGHAVSMRSQIVSTDFVATAAAAKLFGTEPGDIRHIQLAAQMNLGRIDLDTLSINRIKL
jgi:hypothetical protein